MNRDFHDSSDDDRSQAHLPTVGGAEIDRESQGPAPVDLPGDLSHLEEEERAQEISLRQLFAEQEHGLRQKYADWIIWVSGPNC